ncbi:MAG TPA: ABC transporter permease [Chryseolinea sp.]|nr:ABC transporter permease [Chryseolinea sp.]
MKQPPKLARKFFERLSGAANVDDLLGDMDEWFYENVRTKSLLIARSIYWRQVASLSFSYALRKRKRDSRRGPYSSSVFDAGMLNNYLKVAIRNLYQYKYFSIINAFGLALGMSISLLLISLFSYVTTYDNYHAHGDRIFSIASTVNNGAEELQYATAPTRLADKLISELPSAEEVLRITKDWHSVVAKEANIPVGTYYTNADFFSFFSFSLIAGDVSSLNKPDQAVLTERTAKRLFGDSLAIGQTFELVGGALVQVAAIIKDPIRTHLRFDMLISESSIRVTQSASLRDWVEYHNQYVYVRMREGSQKEELEEYLTKTSESLYKYSPKKVHFDIVGLGQVATGLDRRNAIGETWEVSGFILFAIFAALILLPACFNYTNISIARAMRRAKEIALRKTVGGERSQIFFQFITETIVITLIALIGALGIFVVIRREFQSMLVAGSSLDLSLTPRLMSIFVIFAVLTGLAAGIFPALYFARMNPIEAFKSRIHTRPSSFSVRKVLTIFQFVLSFGFILSLFVIGRQYRYAMSFDFGFQKEHIIDVAMQDVRPGPFLAAFSALSSVSSVSQSSGILGVSSSHVWVKDLTRDSVMTAEMFVDRNYISNLGLTFLAGHNFPDELWTRERYMVVNEEFLKAKNIKTPLDAVGKIYQVDGQDLEVIGVLKDFHFAGLIYPIKSFAFRFDPGKFEYANLKVSHGDTYDVLTQMEATWKQLPTEKKFIAKFFEDEMREAYTIYNVMLKMVGFMGLMAITISLLGMVGMVVYTAQSRTREVGIRKVMGAGVQQVIFMLSRDYLKMLLWAIVIGTPLTVFLLNAVIPYIQYYHASISVWDVLLSIAVLMGFGVGTIFLETYKTAVANPAQTLRSE